MAHAVQDVQQEYFMKQAWCKMSANTAYVVFDFKQKFWSRGFREGGDSHYGKKGMQWFGMVEFVKIVIINEVGHDGMPSEDGALREDEGVPHEDEGCSTKMVCVMKMKVNMFFEDEDVLCDDGAFYEDDSAYMYTDERNGRMEDNDTQTNEGTDIHMGRGRQL